MDIQEAKELKGLLERDIRMLILEFKANANLSVTDVAIQTTSMGDIIGGASYLTDVTVTTEGI